MIQFLIVLSCWVVFVRFWLFGECLVWIFIEIFLFRIFGKIQFNGLEMVLNFRFNLGLFGDGLFGDLCCFFGFGLRQKKCNSDGVWRVGCICVCVGTYVYIVGDISYLMLYDYLFCFQWFRQFIYVFCGVCGRFGQEVLDVIFRGLYSGVDCVVFI